MTEDNFKQPRAAPIGQPHQCPNVLAGEMVDDFLYEHLGFVRLHAEIAQRYVDLHDRAGLDYSMRKLIAYVKAVAGTLNDLTDAAQADGGDAP